MTSAQLRLAKTGQAAAWIRSFAEGEEKAWRGWEIDDFGKDKERVRRGWIESLARASMTRAKTYMTIYNGSVRLPAPSLGRGQCRPYLLIYITLFSPTKDCISAQ